MKKEKTPRFINERVLGALALAQSAMMQTKTIKAIIETIIEASTESKGGRTAMAQLT